MNEAILTKKSAATLTEMKQERPKTHPSNAQQ